MFLYSETIVSLSRKNMVTQLLRKTHCMNTLYSGTVNLKSTMYSAMCIVHCLGKREATSFNLLIHTLHIEIIMLLCVIFKLVCIKLVKIHNNNIKFVIRTAKNNGRRAAV